MLRAENKEDRIWFTAEEKKRILKENYGVCACCGKKLTKKTMTMEHIIPLSRGGKNERENLCCLCYDCNQKKGNTFYLPFGYYLAISESARFLQMAHYVSKWYHELPESEKIDLKRYPLISPVALSVMRLSNNTSDFRGHRKTSNVMVSAPLTLKWELVGRMLYAEVEAVTGVDIRETRRYVCQEMASLPEGDGDAGVYLLRKPSSDKLLALVAARFLEERRALCIYIPWANSSNAAMSSIVMQFVQSLILTIRLVAEKEIHITVVDAPGYGILRSFHDERFACLHNRKVATYSRHLILEDDDGKIAMNRVELHQDVLGDVEREVKAAMRKENDVDRKEGI